MNIRKIKKNELKFSSTKRKFKNFKEKLKITLIIN